MQSIQQCSRGDCTANLVLDGLCEEHYRATYIRPLVKEKLNADQISETCRGIINERLRLLNIEVKRVKGDNRLSTEEISQRIRDRQLKSQRGHIDALKYITCRRCFAPFEKLTGEDGLAAHEADCTTVTLNKMDRIDPSDTKPPHKPRTPSGRVAKPKVEVEDLDGSI